MTKSKDPQLEALLTGLGFVAEARQGWTLWRMVVAAEGRAPRPSGGKADQASQALETHPFSLALAGLDARGERREPLAEGEDAAEPELRAEVALTQVGAKAAKGALRKRAPTRSVFPWKTLAFELSERRGSLSLTRLDMALDHQRLLENLRGLARKYFGPKVEVEQVVTSEGDVWCLFEFTRSGTRDKSAKTYAQTAAGTLLPHGIAGFALRVLVEGTSASVVTYGHFGMGYLPREILAAPMRYLADALGLRKPAALVPEFRVASIYEYAFPLALPALIQLAGQNLARAQSAGELGRLLASARAPQDAMRLASLGGMRFVVPADEAMLAHAAQSMESAAVARIPLEVLEARERRSTQADVDALLVAGKHALAAQTLRERWQARTSDDLYLMRRLAYVGLGGRRYGELTFVERALDCEPDHAIFLSYAALAALDQNDQTTALDHLSRLGSRLMARVPGADRLRSFELVLPELLGDAWSAEDLGKAEECYLRVIERRGDLPRVLRKLIHLARVAARPEKEIAYLRRLAAVERRRVELARIFYRHAELCPETPAGRDEALDLCLKALRLDHGLDLAAQRAADILVVKSKPEEAIQLLDSVLRDATSQITAAVRAKLLHKVARIWQYRLRRADLAEARYEQALLHDDENLDVLQDLEAIFRERGRLDDLARMVEAQFTLAEKRGDGEALRLAFDELVTLYRGGLKRPLRAYELYQRLIACVATQPEEIGRVLAWADVDIDWSDLYHRLVVRLSSVAGALARAQYLCRLGEIARLKMNDEATARRHLLAALDDGWIDPLSFRYLVETLTATRDYALLVACYEKRLEQVDMAQKRQTILELLSLPAQLSHARRDQLALIAHLLDPESDKALLGRLVHYRDVEDVEAIERLLHQIVDEPKVGPLAAEKWRQTVVELLSGMSDVSRFAALDRVQRARLEKAADPVAILQEAIGALRHPGGKAKLAFYVAELLGRHILPSLDERLVLELLAHRDQDLALYHELRSIAAESADQAATHARIAAALYARRPGREKETEAMLARMCQLVPCAEGDLAQLTRLVSVTDNWQVLVKALAQQVEFEDDKKRKLDLIERMAQVHWKRLKDFARARLAYVMAMQLTPHTARIKLILAEISAEARDPKNERKALTEFLMDPAASSDVGKMDSAVRRILTLGEERRIVLRLMQPHIDQAHAAHLIELTGKLAGVLIGNDCANTDIFKYALSAAATGKKPEVVVDAFWRGLAAAESFAKAKTFLADAKTYLAGEGQRALLVDCLAAALKHRIGDRLGPKAQQEILIQYGALLFDEDGQRRRALDVYLEAQRSDPEDNRTWMPLYFLLIEFGSIQQRLAHLAAVIPKLEQDARPLRNFPITMESLKAELVHLQGQIDSPLAKANSARELKHEAQANVRPDEQLATYSEATGGEAMLFAQQETPLAGLARVSGEESVAFPRPPAAAQQQQQQRAAAAVGQLPLPPHPTPAPLRVLPFDAGADEDAAAFKPTVPQDGGDDVPAAVSDRDASAPASGEVAGAAVTGLPPLASVAAAAKARWPASDEGGFMPLLPEVSPVTVSSLAELAGAVSMEQSAEFAAMAALAAGELDEHAMLDLAAAPAPDLYLVRGGEQPDPAALANASLGPSAQRGMAAPVDDGFVAMASGEGEDLARFEEPKDVLGGGLSLDLGLDMGENSEWHVAAENLAVGLGADSGDLGAAVAGQVTSELSEVVWTMGDVAAEHAAAAAAPADALAPSRGDAPAKLGRFTLEGGEHELAAAADSDRLVVLHYDSAKRPAVADDDRARDTLPGEAQAGEEPQVDGVKADGMPTDDAQDEAPTSLDGQQVEPTVQNLDVDMIRAKTVEHQKEGFAPAAPSALATSGSLRIGTSSLLGGQMATGTSERTDQRDTGLGSLGLMSAADLPDEAADWRMAVVKGDFNADLTMRLLTQAFASEVEKHLAIQAVALLAGNCDKLAGWHWRVWRKPDEFGYPLAGKERFPQGMSSPHLHSSLHKLVVALAPLCVQIFRERFTLDHVAKRLAISVAAVQKMRKPMAWNSGLLQEVGFQHFASRLAERKYLVYHVAGLGKDIFYEGSTRSVYLDEAHYRKMPPSHLFHRLSGLLWSVRLHSFVPLALHPQKQFMPMLLELHQIFGTHGFSKLRAQLGSKSRVLRLVGKMDLRNARTLYEKTGLPTEDQLRQLWEAMQMHIYRSLIAETLDVVGVFESIVDKDLLKPGVVRHSELVQMTPYAKGLLEFVTKLRI